MTVKWVEKTEEAIEEFNKLGPINKIILFQQAKACQENICKNDEILSYTNLVADYHVLSVIGPYAIIEANNERDEFPFTSAFFTNGIWVHTHKFCATMEEAMFQAIGCRKEGINSRFARYAYNMIKE